ncbi:hypothetical protein LSAT2_019635 [Lamellibrachia satsuma]|nr:hypothetical protein LSAT2_019635 [Lamellibrachia satsuma]
MTMKRNLQLSKLLLELSVLLSDTDLLGTIMEKSKNEELASTGNEDQTTTLDKTAVEAVAASSPASFVERPEEKDHYKALKIFFDNISTQSNQIVAFSKKISDEGVQKCIEPLLVSGDNLPHGSSGEVSTHLDPITLQKIARKKVKCPRTFKQNEARIPMIMRRVHQEVSQKDSFVEILGIAQVNGNLFLLMTAVEVDLLVLTRTGLWRNSTYIERLYKVRLIFGQILLALRSMHEQGFGHLDIKPGNVGFNIDNKQVVIFDFETAREVIDGDACTRQGMTLCYMAPELWRGVLNKKADVFAAGCLVYFLFYGKHMWLDEIKGSETFVNTRVRLSAAEALDHPFFTQFCITDSFTMHTLPHLPDIHTAPESTADNIWTKAETPYISELLRGDNQEKSLPVGDQDRPMDRRNKNMDGLSVAEQVPAGSSDVVMKTQSDEWIEEEQALAGKDPQMVPAGSSDVVMKTQSDEWIEEEQALAGKDPQMIPALSQLLSSVDVTPPQSVEGNQEEQALAGKDPQMVPAGSSDVVMKTQSDEWIEEEQALAGKDAQMVRLMLKGQLAILPDTIDFK